MPILHAIVLGAVQGLTEFLPVSSSGHLAIVPWLFGWNDFDDPEIEKAFAVAVHAGTLLAVVQYFWADIVELTREGLKAMGDRSNASVEGRRAWLLLLSAIPAAIVGLAANSIIDDLDDEIGLIAVMLILFGWFLYFLDVKMRADRSIEEFSTREAVIMGLGQCLALQPGVSRSAATMSAGRGLGFDRESTARLAFLMSIPLIAGAVVFQLVDIGGPAGIPADLRWPFVVGVITAAITGWIAVWGLLRLVKRATFVSFAIYRVIAGVAVLSLLASSIR